MAGDLLEVDDEMAQLLLSIVGNAKEPDALRAAAAIGLGPVLELTETEGFDDDGFCEPPITEETFEAIQETMHRVFDDESTPKEVRRRVLEGSVRSAQDWHHDAILKAAASDDEEWVLTASFCMGEVRGFDEQIVILLDSPNPEIHLEAIQAAGTWGVKAAWPHINALVESKSTPKELLLAAIEAVGGIQPKDAGVILSNLAFSHDEDIREAVTEALLLAGTPVDDDDEDYEEYDEDEDVEE